MDTSLNFKRQNSSPLHGGTALKDSNNDFSLGLPSENFSQNHPVIAESITKTSEINNDTAPTATAPMIVKKGEYHPGYCQELLEYFDKPKMKKIVDTYTWKSGAVSEKERQIPRTPPHFSEFARKIGVSTRTLKSWAKTYPEFGEAMETAQEILEEFLIDNGLLGSYGAIAMKFVAVNRSKMKDKQVNENQTLDLNKVLDGIAQGKLKPGGIMEDK